MSCGVCGVKFVTMQCDCKSYWSEQQIITEFNSMITFRFASIFEVLVKGGMKKKNET